MVVDRLTSFAASVRRHRSSSTDDAAASWTLAPVVWPAPPSERAIYAEFEEIAAANPSDWNFTGSRPDCQLARHRSIDRQRRLSINKGRRGQSSAGSSAAASSLPGVPRQCLRRDAAGQQPPTNDDAWTLRDHPDVPHRARSRPRPRRRRAPDLDVPWPPATSPANQSSAAIEIVRESDPTNDEVHAYLSREVRYRAARRHDQPGGRTPWKARQDDLPAVAATTGREAKWSRIRRRACRAPAAPVVRFRSPRQRFIDEWPTPEGVRAIPVPRRPWQKLPPPARRLRRADEKQRQDAAIAHHATPESLKLTGTLARRDRRRSTSWRPETAATRSHGGR